VYKRQVENLFVLRFIKYFAKLGEISLRYTANME
jgi:hypothetical protein